MRLIIKTLNGIAAAFKYLIALATFLSIVALVLGAIALLCTVLLGSFKVIEFDTAMNFMSGLKLVFLPILLTTLLALSPIFSTIQLFLDNKYLIALLVVTGGASLAFMIIKYFAGKLKK